MGEATMPTAGRLRTPVFDVLLRPRRSLVRSTVLSVVCSAVPLAVALAWVSLPVRWWTLVVPVVLVLAVLVCALFVRLGQAYLGIDAQSVVLRAVLTPNRHVARDRLHRLVVATTYGASADRTTRELLAFDADGRPPVPDARRRLGRVRPRPGARGPRPPRRARPSSPVHTRELARRWPASRTWYERRAGVLVVALLTVGIGVALLAVETVELLAR